MTNNRLIIEDLPIADLKVAYRKPVADSRGFLERIYCRDIFDAAGINESLSQINLTLTKRCGAVRGMHYQVEPYAEDKVVTCIRGKIFDVAVDLRQDSPTFLKWHAEILSPDLNKSYIIPKGFAHGFQALTDDCELLYLHTVPYHAEAEGGISPVDSLLDIKWPLPISDISDRDKSHPALTNKYKGFANEM